MRGGRGKDPSGSVWRRYYGEEGNISIGRQESQPPRCGLAGCYPWWGEVSNSRCVHILKVEQAEFANDLNIGCGRKKGIKDGCNALV